MADVTEPTASAITSTTSMERRIVSVLFADLVGFTSLSERLDAEDMATVQDAYFASVRETIERHGGVVEKFIGDAAMAVFGTPQTRDDDAERAVRAGLALISAVEQVGARLALEPGELQLRVGINSGEVVHATDGPAAGRVTGDTVNTAARLQAAAEPNGVLIGEFTALAVRGSIELTEMGELGLKGKSEPVRAWQAHAVRPEPSRDAALGDLRAPMLGRDEELARLESMRSGRLTIIAPPGVGKSRLVAELAGRAATGGAHVLRARARPQAAGPYEVIAQLLAAAGAPAALGAALERSEVHPGRREVITADVESLLRPGAAEAAATDLAAERDARFAAWDEALAALVAPAQTVWIVEDVHWAGPDLLAFLGRPSGERRLVICTTRPSLLESAPDWIEAAERMDLETLPDQGAGDLIRALVGDAIPSELVGGIADRSDGNPLFIEELLRTWISVGTLVPAGDERDRWRLAVDPGAVTLPATVQAIYAAQLDDLPADARLVARRASVAGRRFADAALVPLELADRRDGLDNLRRRAFIVGPQADPVAGDVYAYRHALLRDAGYASLARAERSRLHAGLARWLEESAGERSGDVAQLVAEHYADALASLPAIGAAGRAELAVSAADWFERAAEAALVMAAPAEAIRLLGRSIQLTDGAATVAAARRRLRLGAVMADSADLDAGITEMTRALRLLAAELPETAALHAEAAYALGLAYMQQTRFSEAEALTADALAHVTDAAHPAGSARLHALHAWSVAANGRVDGVVEEARRARDLGAAVGDPVLELDLLQHWAAVKDEAGEPDLAAWDELDERARALGRWRQVAIASRIRGVMRADRDPRGGLAILDAMSEVARAHGLTEQEGWSDLARADTLMVAGDWDAALAAADRAIGLGERYAYQRLAFRTWMVALPMLSAREDPSWLPRFETWWDGAISNFPPTPSPYGAVLRAATGLWLARARGEPLDGPIELPDEIPPFSNPHFLAAREIVAERLLAIGDLDRAAAIGGAPDDDWGPLMRASQALVSAWVAVARGDAAAAVRHSAESAEHARSIGATWWLARALAASGASDDAAELLHALGVPS